MNLLQASLTGGAAFRDISVLLEGLTWEGAQAELPGVPYCLADLLAHLALTMRTSLDLVSGRIQEWPPGLDVWPEPPLDEGRGQALMADLSLMLAEAAALAEDPSGRSRDLLTDLAVHNAYHWGQVALWRRLHGVSDFEGDEPGEG